MNFPFVVQRELTPCQRERYRRHIDSDASGWHRRWTESIWRRHQHPSNAVKSGWRGEGDAKRRLLHFYDEYGLEGNDFVLRRAYLSLNLTLPADGIEEYRVAIRDGLLRGGWQRAAGDTWKRGDLCARVTWSRVHREDQRRGRTHPPGYEHLDVEVRTSGYVLPEGRERRPWDVFFDVGLRKTLARGKPQAVSGQDLGEYFPAQLELGCGPSIEAGIPHLSTLHRIYGVSRPDYSFIFSAAADRLLDLFRNPEGNYAEMTDIYRACLTAESTPFYDGVRDLWKTGALVGPIITNNFDCQCASLGLPEISLRRYDTTGYYPVINYDTRARSLFVVGVHADRRLVQMRARERGLRVIFIDPEQYVAPDGQRIPYPLEAPQDDDLLVSAGASDAMSALRLVLAGRR